MLQKSSSQRVIMIVDDDVDNLRLLSRILQHEGYVVEQAGTAEEALVKLQSLQPDMVLLDINMPGMSGFDILRQVRLSDHYISVIFISGRGQSQDVVVGLDSGADDYICKPFDPLVMLARVRAQLRLKDLNDQLADANAKLQELVDIDDLTQLYNMRSIYTRIGTEIKRARRYRRSVGVVMMDMDDFKSVNDTNDHLFGSYVLSEVGKLIRQNIRQVDFAARYGGDEFLIVLTETSEAGAVAFAERLRILIEKYVFQNQNAKMHLTASLGIAIADSETAEIDARSLVRFADNTLYEAKHAGKNCVRVHHFSPPRRNTKKRAG